MAPPAKPIAIAYEQEVAAKPQRKTPGTRRAGKDERVLLPGMDTVAVVEIVGHETIRRGTCPTHGKPSTDFNGVNSGGWVFRCAGYSAETLLPDPEQRHYFTNLPADTDVPC